MNKRIAILIFLALLCLFGCSWDYNKQFSVSWTSSIEWFVSHENETIYIIPTVTAEDGKKAFQDSLFNAHLIIGSEHWDLDIANNLVKNMNLVSATLYSNKVDNWRKTLVVNKDFYLSADSTLPRHRDFRKIQFEQVIIPQQIDTLWLTIDISTSGDSTRELQSNTWLLNRSETYKRIFY